jgi:hypothetical protein
MTYYEELGISADAAEEDIRQAHRRLVKLLHPDQQSNDELRRLAELQLMRINALVEQLLDPTQRRLYDLTIRSPLPSIPPAANPEARGVASNEAITDEAIQKGWKYAFAGVSIVILAWIFSAGSPTDVVRSVTTGVLSATTASAASEAAPARIKSEVRPTPPKSWPKGTGISSGVQPAPEQPLEVPSDRPPAGGQDSRLPENLASAALPVSPPPSVVEPAQKAVPKAPDPAPTFAGTWLYAGGKRTAEDERLYRPEYIELRIQDNGGQLYGEYRSRYAVTDLPISPAVNFRFQGNPAGSATLPWKGPNGSSGTVALKLLNRNAMQVDWKLTDAGDSGIGLEFGTAILVRRL